MLHHKVIATKPLTGVSVVRFFATNRLGFISQQTVRVTKLDLSRTEVSHEGFATLARNNKLRRPRASDGKLINIAKGKEELGEFVNFHRVADEADLVSMIDIDKTMEK